MGSQNYHARTTSPFTGIDVKTQNLAIWQVRNSVQHARQLTTLQPLRRISSLSFSTPRGVQMFSDASMWNYLNNIVPKKPVVSHAVYLPQVWRKSSGKIIPGGLLSCVMTWVRLSFRRRLSSQWS